MWGAGGALVESIRLYTRRVTKSNAETTGDLPRLRKSGQRRCKFPCTFEAHTHQGKKAKSERGRGAQNAKSSVSRRDTRRTWRGGADQKSCGDAVPLSAG